MTTRRYALLIPVKDGRRAKSRLGVGSDARRAGLMAAFAHDAIAAAMECPEVEVYVVGDAENLAGLLTGLRVPVLPDEGAGSLNRALERAAAMLGDPDHDVAVLLADLPCLRSNDLSMAFGAAAETGRRSFVADAQGTGTTLLVSPAGTRLDPRFGEGSAAAHLASGAHPIGAGIESLRLDVDTTADLEAALRFGVGPATAAATSQLA